jgi:hypothetical protein
MRPCSQPRKCQTWPSVSDSDGKRDSPLRTLTILAGIPHANTIDYGNRIPAGTSTTEKMWAFNRNPRDFPSPNVVRPGDSSVNWTHRMRTSEGEMPPTRAFGSARIPLFVRNVAVGFQYTAGPG